MNASPSSAAARATPLEVSPPTADAGSVVFGPRALPWVVLAWIDLPVSAVIALPRINRDIAAARTDRATQDA